jgi:hypothetical protein
MANVERVLLSPGLVVVSDERAADPAFIRLARLLNGGHTEVVGASEALAAYDEA